MSTIWKKQPPSPINRPIPMACPSCSTTTECTEPASPAAAASLEKGLRPATERSRRYSSTVGVRAVILGTPSCICASFFGPDGAIADGEA
jgi:hypothetical protein